MLISEVTHPKELWDNQEVPLLEFHVDEVRFDFSKLRMDNDKYPLGGLWSKKIDWTHPSSKRLIHVVQDESICKSYAAQRMIVLCNEDLQHINDMRTIRGKEKLTSIVPLDPHGFSYLFIRLFNYGTGNGKEGYWDHKHMIKQVDEFIDVFEVKFPGCTVDMSFDWSSGHAAYSEDALVLSNFNAWYGVLMPIRQGEEQYLSFRAGDLPPFYCQKSKCKPTDYIGKPI
ncbi:hypothetical protein EMCRGX_G001793 [Ephydatia muelleri]